MDVADRVASMIPWLATISLLYYSFKSVGDGRFIVPLGMLRFGYGFVVLLIASGLVIKTQVIPVVRDLDTAVGSDWITSGMVLSAFLRKMSGNK